MSADRRAQVSAGVRRWWRGRDHRTPDTAAADVPAPDGPARPHEQSDVVSVEPTAGESLTAGAPPNSNGDQPVVDLRTQRP